MTTLAAIAAEFGVEAAPGSIRPLGEGLINDTYLVATPDPATPDYLLQRINTDIFRDLDTLQGNIDAVTAHIRRKLIDAGAADIDRKVLRFMPATQTAKTYYIASDGSAWRMMVYIPDSVTLSRVDCQGAWLTGRAFGDFQQMLSDIPDALGETIPRFHDMEFRLEQFDEAVAADRAGRLSRVRPIVDDLLSRAEEMTAAERLHRSGVLPKRVCHCDTKLNNILFDRHGAILCVIDLDTVMPSFVFSDIGDFLRTAASTVAEDAPDLAKVDFRTDIFKAFIKGYLETADFLTPLEKSMIPYAARLFPYMQAVRFLTDYLNGDVYYKTAYADHNLVRTRNQLCLLKAIERKEPELNQILADL